MKPVIHEFKIDSDGEPLNGGYKLGVLPKGMTIWTYHTSFVNGVPTVTIIGVETVPKPSSN